jgi:DNA-binding LacI/PurR family transcriptional regulator
MTTLRDIAERAGVSTCAVSKILNGASGHERFSNTCQERVRTAAKDLGFMLNSVARALRTGTTGIIAFAVNWAPARGSRGFQAAMIEACEGATRHQGSHLLVVGGGADRSAAKAVMELAARRQCDGIIIPGAGLGHDEIDALLTCGTPVSFFGDLPDEAERGVDIDNQAGIESAVQHLASLGHRRLAWLGKSDLSRTCKRRNGFVSSCTALGLDGRLVDIPPYLEHGDEACIAHARSALLDRRSDLADRTALVCYHDLLALGAYAAFAELGWQVPHQVSIVGFDNVHAATALPSLTTIDHELYAMAEGALMALHEEPRRRLVTPRLVVRSSSGAVHTPSPR